MRTGPRLIGDRRGTSVIEFALALPLLLLIFTGGFQLNDAVANYRKLTVTTRTIADLTSQFAAVNNDKIATILNASRQVMLPYSPSGATIVISQVKIDGSNNPVVDWSCSRGVDALTPGNSIALAADLRQPNTYLLVARMSYSYRPLFGSAFIGTIPLSETIVMSPRVSEQVSKEAAPCSRI